MRRYTVRPRSWEGFGEWERDKPFLPSLDVYERDNAPQRTGLLDSLGNELFASEEREPVGFMRFP